MKNKHQYFAEVIQSSLDSWLAQCWNWTQVPLFGSIVVIEYNNKKLFGIVNSIQTGSMDPVRSPMAYQKTHEELLQEQPQIFEFLKTNFSCLALGYQEKNEDLLKSKEKPFDYIQGDNENSIPARGKLVEPYEQKLQSNFIKIWYMLAPEPPKIHSFIRAATHDENLDFFKKHQYLQLIFAHENKIFNLDELLLALLKNLWQVKLVDENGLQEFLDTYSLITNNDYRRLKLFLQRAESLLD